MLTSSATYLSTRTIPSGNRCLSCGTVENMGRRRYCSIGCRQNLRRKLNARTGLLRALKTRYAAFYFTDHVIAMDVLPYNARDIFSFIYPRQLAILPADGFCRMSDMLGNAWWTERRRTNRAYLANRTVLNHASRAGGGRVVIEPEEIRKPSISDRTLVRLQLGKRDLESGGLQQTIKHAFRQQAKKHHPDIGGDAPSFRRLVQAYEELIGWAESPSFITRRGFPDKWFYDGNRNRWVQPIPEQKPGR